MSRKEEVMTRISKMTLLLLASAGWLRAQEGAPSGPTRTLDEGVGVSVNALGAQHTYDLEWRWRVSESSDLLHGDAHASLGVTHALTPSYTRLGGWAEFYPLSVVGVRAGVEPGVYFGVLGSLMSFAGPSDPFGDEARNARKADARAGSASRLYVSPSVRMRVGPFLALGTGTVEWWHSSAEGPYYYEPSRDTLLRAGGDRVFTTSSMLLHQVDVRDGGSLAFGIGHSLTAVQDAPENESQKVSAILARQFGSKRFGLHSPRIVGQVSYYLRDPNRRGQFAVATGLSWRVGR
jgi:hypothetical protein